MTEATPDRDLQKGNAASALPPAVRRSEQPDFAPSVVPEPDDFDPNDTTSILQGGKAFSGKALLSAARTAVSADPFSLYQKTLKEQDEREAQEARELAHLTEWNTRTTMIDGVQMTNGQAQEARCRVRDNDEKYAQWAVDHGHIREDEKDAFKQGIRRKIELEDRRGRGISTEQDEHEAARLDTSRVGKALNKATAMEHEDAALKAKASSSYVPGKGLDEAATFQAAQAPPDHGNTPQRAPLAPAVKVMGLGL